MEIKMKAYKGVFKKKNGEDRTMVFSRIDDLPSSFVASKIQGAGQEQKYPDGMELVWDLEADSFGLQRGFGGRVREEEDRADADGGGEGAYQGETGAGREDRQPEIALVNRFTIHNHIQNWHFRWGVHS